MIKRISTLLLLIWGVVTVYSQNIQRLESEPTFKGITIGMPIHSIANKLSFNSVVNGDTMYDLTDSQYYSVFGISMNHARIVVRNSKVYMILIVKTVQGSESNPTIFDASELQTIERGLIERFGRPTQPIYKQGEVYTTGSQWNSKTKAVGVYMDFYGTFNGYMLVFSMGEGVERKVDF
jgi:hypothetical protein